MIFDSFLSFFLHIGQSILDAVLPVSTPPDMSATLSGMLHLYGWINEIVPADEILVWLGIAFTVELLLTAIATTLWTLGRFPFGKWFGGT